MHNITLVSCIVVVVDDVTVANGFSPCSLVKELNWGHRVKGRCFSFDVTLTSWEEEEMEEEEDSSWISGKTTHSLHAHAHTHTWMFVYVHVTQHNNTHMVAEGLNMSK